MPTPNSNPAVSPVPKIIPLRVERYAYRRWVLRFPFTLSRVREIAPEQVERALELARERHLERIVSMWERGLSWYTIVSRNLDDPLMPTDLFNERLASVNARSRRVRFRHTRGLQRIRRSYLLDPWSLFTKAQFERSELPKRTYRRGDNRCRRFLKR
jgi:hypothetical protein